MSHTQHRLHTHLNGMLNGMLTQSALHSLPMFSGTWPARDLRWSKLWTTYHAVHVYVLGVLEWTLALNYHSLFLTYKINYGSLFYHYRKTTLIAIKL